MTIKYPFPSPDIIWGNYKVDSWTRQQNNSLSLCLMTLISNIIYLESQEKINKIINKIAELINSAKSGNLEFKDVVIKLQNNCIFSHEDIIEIHNNERKYGQQLGLSYINQTNEQN